MPEPDCERRQKQAWAGIIVFLVLAVGGWWLAGDDDPSPTTAPAATLRPPPTTAVDGLTAQVRYDRDKANRTTTTRRPATTLSEYERDFDNCRMLNSMIESTLEDAQAGLASEHEALSRVRMGLDTMELLDCGRFSSTASREMGQHGPGAAVRRVLRSVGY